MAYSSSQPTFSVTRGLPELVVPARPTPYELKALSDIDDQEGLREHIPGIIFYRRNPTMDGKDPAQVIRGAIASALVFYYPLAGRLVEGQNRKILVDCTAEGVLFIEADADITLEELGDAILPPCPNLEELVYNVPGFDGILGCPMLHFQVTRLSCGGFILGSWLNHTICDAYGFFQFLKAVGEIAQGKHEPSVPPVWQREILSARQPPVVTCRHYEYDDTIVTKSTAMNQGDTVQRSIFFGPKEIKALKQQLSDYVPSSSTFEVLAACLWRCRTVALQLHYDEEVRFSCMVSVRSKGLIQVPSGYYGNAFVYPAVTSRAGLLCENSLGYAVEQVRKVKSQVTQEYVRSVADLMVLKGRPMYTMSSTYMVSDTRNVGSEDVDFGWGKPIYSGAAVAVTISSFLVKYKNSMGEDGIVASICLPLPIMERFQEEIRKATGLEQNGLK